MENRANGAGRTVVTVGLAWKGIDAHGEGRWDSRDVDGLVGMGKPAPTRGYNLNPETKVKDPRLRASLL